MFDRDGSVESVVIDDAGVQQGPIAVLDDGSILASGYRGGVWKADVTTDEVRGGRSLGASSLMGVVASADGSVLAAQHGFASSIALLDGATLEPIGEPIPAGDVGEWVSVVLAADGTRLLANDAFNHATEWNLDVATWPAIACRAAGRNLTRSEFATYFGADAPYRATCPDWPVPDA
jgi:hypothetical protein